MIEKHLQGRVAWITGSSRGIGLAIAERLAQCGASVVLHGSSATSPQPEGVKDSLPVSVERIQSAFGVKAMVVYGDLSQPEIVRTVVAQIHEQLGQIDILINNAGGDIGVKGVAAPSAGKPDHNDAVFIGDEDLRMVLDRNLMTCIHACREVVPEMIERKRGWVVNIGSIAGLGGVSGSAIYATAKAAVHEYTRCLAAMLRPHGVYANAVAPGNTLSERFMVSRPIDEDKVNAGVSLERYGLPLEMAHAVEFLVSDAASYVSGQILRVDGGQQLWPA